MKSFSGSVNSLDGNGAEMPASFMGCHELQNLGGYSAIIEGYSFSAIQWGSKETSFPWRLANWVEDVQDTTSQLNFTLSHIL